MKKFLAACAFALVLGLATSGQAHAQIVYPAYGGVESTGTNWSSYGPQTYTKFYSPITGYMGETSGTMNTLFSRGNYTSIYSPFTGYMTESRGTVMTPFGQASYLSYYSPYTGPVSETRLGNGNSTTSTNSNLTNFNNIVPYGNHWWTNNNTNNNGRHR